MLTKLQAVNRILRANGEPRVSSLTSGATDAEEAEAVLDEVTTSVLSEGWYVNTDEGVTLSLDENDRLPVPADALRIDASDVDADKKVVVRRRTEDSALYLWDLEDRTFTFDDGIIVDIVRDYAFEDLTHALQEYIAAFAAVVYQQGELSSVVMDAFTKDQLNAAKARALDEDAELADSNILTDSLHARSIARRHSRYSGT
jgi:hypothetical protein